MSTHRLPERIETDEDLLIRRWQPTDAAAMNALIAANLDHLRPWMAWAGTEPLSTEARLRLFTRWDGYWASGDGAIYAIEGAGELMGGCSLHRRIGPGGIDLGYWLGQHHTGQGIATRVAGALAQASFTVDDIEFVQISHTPSNEPSGAVAERLGFSKLTATTEHTVTTWQLARRR